MPVSGANSPQMGNATDNAQTGGDRRVAPESFEFLYFRVFTGIS